MPTPTLVVLSRQGRQSLSDADWARLDKLADVRVVQREDAPDLDEAVALLAGADLLGATNLCLPTIDAALLDRLPRLRGIALYATGYDHLDVPLLARRGVGLCVLPDYATEAVAEHSLAMLMAMATRLHLAHDRSRGASCPQASLRGIELAGRTLGVVGLGRIGSRMAQFGAALGMRVLGTDPDPTAATAAAARGIEVVGVQELLGSSSAVTMCASHEYGAPPVLGSSEISAMPPGSLLVNVARSALVDTGAALAAVRTGHLRGYAVDDVVCDPVVDADVLAQGRVLQTGHSAWWRDEVLVRGSLIWADRLVAAVSGEPLDAVTWPSTVLTPA